MINAIWYDLLAEEHQIDITFYNSYLNLQPQL